MPIRKDREEELESMLNRGALWAITYGDLMSYLMIFFLVMFAFNYTKSVSMQMGLHSIQRSFGGKEKFNIDELFSKYGLQQFAKVEISEQKLRITFNEAVLFDSGSADLKEQSLPILKRVANILREVPNPIMIEGHSDDIPPSPRSRYRTNWELSMARAYNVLMFFIENEKLPPTRLSAIGYGEYQPTQPNDSPEGRAANRRIEIALLRTS